MGLRPRPDQQQEAAPPEPAAQPPPAAEQPVPPEEPPQEELPDAGPSLAKRAARVLLGAVWFVARIVLMLLARFLGVGPGFGRRGISTWSEDGQMHMELKAGELPTAIQFLCTSQRTGRLEVTFASPEKGQVWLDNGKLVHAEHIDMQDSDALALMIAKGDGVSCFFDGEEAPAQTVTLPTDHIILQASVLSDERYDVSVTGEQEEQPGAMARLRTGAAHYLRLSWATAWPCIKVSIILLLAVFLGTRTPAWLLQRGIQKHLEARLQAQQDALQQRVGGLIGRAQRAIRRRQYAEAREIISIALGLDPGHPRVRSLSKEVSAEARLADIVPAKSKAEQLWQSVEQIDPGQGMGARKEAIEQRFTRAQSLLDGSEHRGALEMYTELVTECQTTLKLDATREEAKRSRTLAQRSLGDAAKVNAAEGASSQWENARLLATNAEKAFGDGLFKEANDAWTSAIAQLKEAIELAYGGEPVRLAKSAFQRSLTEADIAMLEKHGGAEWEKVQGLQKEALALETEGRLLDGSKKWDEARSAIPAARKAAVGRQLRAEFETAMTEGGRLAALQQWKEAEAAFRRAAAVEGFGDDPNIARRLRELEQAVEKEKTDLVAAARDADSGARWEDLRRLAEQILALDPQHAEGQALKDKAFNNSDPLVAVVAEINGKEVDTARISIDGGEPKWTAPHEFKWPFGKAVRITVTVPPDEGTYYAPFVLDYPVDQRGRHTVRAAFSPVPPPQPGEAFAVPGLDLGFVPIPAGDLKGVLTSLKQEPLSEFTATFLEPFWMSACEVTQAQYEALIAANPSSTKGGKLPVSGVNWFEAQDFCAALTKREAAAGRLPEGHLIRLPTELEWEYACRAGSRTVDEPDLDSMAWHCDNSRGHAREVGGKPANAWGLHDMYGNVWEWCQDWLGANERKLGRIVFEEASASMRARRGGSWFLSPRFCRADYRAGADPNKGDFTLGFRVVLAQPTPRAEGTWVPLAAARPSAPQKPVIGKSWSVPGLGLELVAIQPGSFVMRTRSAGGRGLRMKVRQAFWMGRTEVTQDEYTRVAGANPSKFNRPTHPVDSVSWWDASAFCAALNERERAQGRLLADFEYRLPTETEWEYCCRAGSAGGFAGPLAGLAWYAKNSNKTTHPVKTKDPNLWGLYDTHGNVWEWCLGGSGDKPYRGGSWYNLDSYCQASKRMTARPDFSHPTVGFRVALAPIRDR